MIIEYRYPQGATSAILAILKLQDGRYWNNAYGDWRSSTPVVEDGVPLYELTAANIAAGVFDDMPASFNKVVTPGLYAGTTQSAFTGIAAGVLYSIDAYSTQGASTYRYESATSRLQVGSKTFLEIINEVQRRISYPLSKTLNEPNARKIGAFTNDIIGMILAAGNQTFNLKTDYSVILRAGTNAINVFPANCYGIQNIKSVYIDQKPILLLQAFPNRTIGEFNKPAILPNGNPMKYIVKSVSQYNTILQFDQKPVTDKTVDLEIIEKPAKLENATDTCVFDSDLVIKGVEYLMRDEVGLGGDVPGRVLFQEYLTATMNSTADPNWETLHA